MRTMALAEQRRARSPEVNLPAKLSDRPVDLALFHQDSEGLIHDVHLSLQSCQLACSFDEIIPQVQDGTHDVSLASIELTNADLATHAA